MIDISEVVRQMTTREETGKMTMKERGERKDDDEREERGKTMRTERRQERQQ